ncbi:MAG TPA: NAD-dependent epimerase/dehydratase family protein [Anaerolineales bacterium]|nr:epimerase [Anaerolineae bacterium]HRJ58156.1 NAD-dependent epimerase/dehydratase family protein [Anaerolineales bacterium]HRK90743.1 NAD-dependent epimerase/dehydratase family protein [Anaerolineales bacterium]
MKYFVTGATGFVGGVLAKKLRAAGHEVNASVRSPEKAKDLQALGVKLFKGDVTEKGSMREAMTGVEGVYHVAGWYKVGAKDKRGGVEVNINGTRNVLELMQELKIPKGVYTSTLAVNSDTKGKLVDEAYHFTGQHLSEYDRTKAAAHDIANEFIAKGLPLVIVQPGLIYGPGDTSSVRTSLINFLRGQLPMLPYETTLCWAHVDDIVDGHILAMEKGKIGESYHICGEPYKLYDAYQLASKVSGKRAPMGVSPNLMKAMSALVKPLDAILPESYTSEGLRIIAGVTYIGDNSKAKRELGFDPRPVSAGWAETVKYEMELMGI